MLSVHNILHFFARVLVILLGSTRESRYDQVMATTTRCQRKYDHRLRELVRATGNIEVSLGAVERLVAFYVQEHNTRLPHSAFRGQTPDEMYSDTGKAVPQELATARQAAREARLRAHRESTCQTCEPLTEVCS